MCGKRHGFRFPAVCGWAYHVPGPVARFPADHGFPPGRRFGSQLGLLQAVGLQVDAQPLSCARILNNDLGIRMTLQPEEAASYGQELLMEVWLPLCADGSALIPHVQVPRYHGTINFSGSDELLTPTPGRTIPL